MPNLFKFSVSKPTNWPKILKFRKPHMDQKALQGVLLSKIQFSKPPCKFGADLPFRPFGQHTPTKIKVEYPLRVLSGQQFTGEVTSSFYCAARAIQNKP